MAFTIPDKTEGVADIQSRVYQEDFDIMIAGLRGLDCVLSGFDVTGGADMTPAIAKGSVLTNGVLKAVAAADVTITTADATNPRLDLIVVNSSGALAVRAGTPAAEPKPPVRSTNDVVLYFVYVPANDTAIATGQCIDKRIVREQGPLCIYKTTTAEVTNSTTGAINILDKTNSGVVIPDGLFLAGRVLRVSIGGNYLFNSGTPTLTLTVIYGGTTMFADATVAALADADRGAWRLDILIVAQANNDQALSGVFWLQPAEVARAAPTTGGPGDLAFANTSNRLGSVNFAGSAAVDSNAGNRTLQVQFTMNVNNSADEIVVEGATLEIL